MQEPKKVKINSGVERLLKDFCFRRNKNIDEFIEEAILEKIEREEFLERVSEILDNYDAREEILKEYLLDEFYLYKKKH